jgi:hypothetical protein
MTIYNAVEIAEGIIKSTYQEQIDAWQYLIDTGTVWTLQGSFGRTAKNLIEQDICHK